MLGHAKRAAAVALCALTGASALAALPAHAAQAAGARRAAARTLHQRTRDDLAAAMRGEAYAHARYALFAVQADHEGARGVARLFRRTSAVELGEHFAEQAALSHLVRSDAADLRAAIAGEVYESTVMYPRFARRARAHGDYGAAAVFAQTAHDEAAHARAFRIALRVVEHGRGRIPKPPHVDAAAVYAGPPRVRSASTMADLYQAMHGEALANARYLLDAEHALHSGRPALARLFAGAAAVELREHFTEEAGLAGAVRGTGANLGSTIAGELREGHFMYPRFAHRAARVGDRAAARLFRADARDELGHAAAFRYALLRGE